MSEFQFNTFEELGVMIDSYSKSELDRAYTILYTLSKENNCEAQLFLQENSAILLRRIGFELTFKLFLRFYKKNFKNKPEQAEELCECMKSLSLTRVREDSANISFLLDEYCY